MKNQSTETMVTHIRAILEQNQNPEDLVSRNDLKTLSIETLIANFLEEAVSMAVVNADETLFQNITQAVYVYDWNNYDGEPLDFIDFCQVKNVQSTTGTIKSSEVINSTIEKGAYSISNGYAVNNEDKTVKYKIYHNADEALDELQSGKFCVLNRNFVKLIYKNSFELTNSMQRLLQIECDKWNGVVKELVEKSSPLFRMCQNKYLNLVGVKDRPIGFKDFSNNSRMISVFPKADNWIKLQYIPKSFIGKGKIGDETGLVYNTTDDNYGESVIPCDDLLFEGACFYCAYLVAMVQGWQTSSTYRQEAVEALKVVNAESVKAAAQSLTSNN